MQKSDVTEIDVLRAIQKKRHETEGAIGPSLREIEDELGLSFSSIWVRVQNLRKQGRVSYVETDHGKIKRMRPGSLIVTDAGRKVLADADRSDTD